MLKTLLKKQLYEVFKSYFYDAKKNKMRSKLGIAAWFVFFAVIMVGVLGGMFGYMSLSLCGPFTAVEMDFMYFLLMGSMAVLLGALGSVYNTYSTLYLSKDNDLLLSMPIPVRDIVAARLINVYMMGTMYILTVMVPMETVYLMVSGFTLTKLLGGLLYFIFISLFVMILSCLIGIVVARVSLRLKHRSLVTMITTLLFLGAYYFVYFKASVAIRNLAMNALVYGEIVKENACFLFWIGSMAAGNFVAGIIAVVITGAVAGYIWNRMLRSFTGIATTTARVHRGRVSFDRIRKKSLFGAVLGKEFARLTSSPNYMLNCALGVFMIPAFGVYLLLEGREFLPLVDEAVSSVPYAGLVLVCTVLCLLAVMNDMAAPSVSLEGKNLWILQSLPVDSRLALSAKATVEILLTGIPMFFAAICGAVVVEGPTLLKVSVFLLPMSFVFFKTMMDTFIAINLPILTWTNEIEPIKHSGGVLISLFGGWAGGVAFCLLYFFFGYLTGATIYLMIWILLYLITGSALAFWLGRKGTRIFMTL